MDYSRKEYCIKQPLIPAVEQNVVSEEMGALNSKVKAVAVPILTSPPTTPVPLSNVTVSLSSNVLEKGLDQYYLTDFDEAFSNDIKKDTLRNSIKNSPNDIVSEAYLLLKDEGYSHIEKFLELVREVKPELYETIKGKDLWEYRAVDFDAAFSNDAKKNTLKNAIKNESDEIVRDMYFELKNEKYPLVENFLELINEVKPELFEILNDLRLVGGKDLCEYSAADFNEALSSDAKKNILRDVIKTESDEIIHGVYFELKNEKYPLVENFLELVREVKPELCEILSVSKTAESALNVTNEQKLDVSKMVGLFDLGELPETSKERDLFISALGEMLQDRTSINIDSSTKKEIKSILDVKYEMLFTNGRGLKNLTQSEIKELGVEFFKNYPDSPKLIAKALAILYQHDIELSPEQKTILIEKSKSFLCKIKDNLTKVEVFTLNKELSFLREQDKKKIFSTPNMEVFKKNWKLLAQDKNHYSEVDKISKDYKTHIEKHGSFVDIKHKELLNFNLQMPGVALMASYLTQKNKVDGLFVCGGRAALLKEIDAVAANPKDQREVLIIGANGASDAPVHKISICIEKKNGFLNVLVLDSMGESSYCSEVRQDVKETLTKSGCEHNLYSTTFKREHSGYGCAIFALQDAICFLQDKDFLQKITSEKGGGDNKIKELPPACMIGTQSISEITRYGQKNPNSLTQPVLSGKTIESSLNKYKIKNVNDKYENHYITKKHFKYQHIIVSCLENLPTAQIQSMIDKSFLN